MICVLSIEGIIQVLYKSRARRCGSSHISRELWRRVAANLCFFPSFSISSAVFVLDQSAMIFRIARAFPLRGEWLILESWIVGQLRLSHGHAEPLDSSGAGAAKATNRLSLQRKVSADRCTDPGSRTVRHPCRSSAGRARPSPWPA